MLDQAGSPPLLHGLVQRRRRISLRARLGLLVLAGVLPLLCYNLANVYLDYRQARERTSRQSLELARGLALAVEGELKARIAALEVLALANSLARGDLATFRAQAQAVVALQQPGANILLLRTDGQQLVNTAVSAEVPLPRRVALENLQRVLATGRPAVSDLYPGLVVRRPVVAIEVPVRGPAGGIDMVLAMNPGLAAFEDVIRRQRPEGGWTISLVDRAGNRIARVPDGERMIGQPISANFRQSWTAEEGSIELIGADGVAVLGGYRRLPEAGWTVAVSLARDQLSGPALRAGGLALAVGLGLLGFGLLLANWVARGITGPIAALRAFAAATEGPEDPPLPVTHLAEVDEVAAVLLAQAGRRRLATAAQADSERRLRLVVGELNHRAKNTLSTVLALAHQTARGSAGGNAESFNKALSARLRGLARAHELLAAEAWEKVELDQVVHAGLAPWLEGFNGGSRRIRVECVRREQLPPASPAQAQALVLALHELATNAMKHGALSIARGTVLLRCCPGEEPNSAEIEWREVGGPPVARPGAEHRGFGMRLLQRGLARDLGPQGSVKVEFAADGLVAVIRYAAEPPPRP